MTGRGQEPRLSHGITGVCSEVGELAQLLERWRHFGHALDPARVADEAGDLLWYLALTLDAVGLEMGAVMEANLRKLAARPDGAWADLTKRDRAAEAAVVSEAAGGRYAVDNHGFGHVVLEDDGEVS